MTFVTSASVPYRDGVDRGGTVAPLAWLGRLLARPEIRFLIVGGLNTAVGLVAFALLYLWWGDVLHYLGALIIAYTIGSALGFVLHRRFVFRVRGRVLLDLVRFVGVQAASLALNSLLLPVLVEVVGLPVLPGQVVALALVVVATYFGHTWISFRRPTAPETTPETTS